MKNLLHLSLEPVVGKHCILRNIASRLTRYVTYHPLSFSDSDRDRSITKCDEKVTKCQDSLEAKIRKKIIMKIIMKREGNQE